MGRHFSCLYLGPVKCGAWVTWVCGRDVKWYGWIMIGIDIDIAVDAFVFGKAWPVNVSSCF